MGIKFKLKLHSPSWHSGGKKFKADSWLRFRGDGSAKLRTGWREHEHGGYQSPESYPYKRLSTLARPQASAKNVAAQGNYANPLRSRYG